MHSMGCWRWVLDMDQAGRTETPIAHMCAQMRSIAQQFLWLAVGGVMVGLAFGELTS